MGLVTFPPSGVLKSSHEAYGGPRPRPLRAFYAGVAAPQHWFDLTDPNAVFRDTQLSSLATEGDLIRGILNKGTDGQPLVQAGADTPTYNLGIVNGLAVATSLAVDGDQLSTLMTSSSGATTMSIALVARRTDGANTLQKPFSWGDSFIQSGLPDSSGNWDAAFPNALLSTGKPTIDDEWIWAYGTIDSVGGAVFSRASLENEATSGFGGFGYVPVVNGRMTLGAFEGQIAEAIIWEGVLDATDKTNLIAGWDAYYGAMPL